MASLQNVNVGRQTYDRMVESRRVNGTPRPIPSVQLGTAAPLLQRLLTQPPPPYLVHAYRHGEVAALKAMADRLGLVARSDPPRPTSRRPRSLGTTLVLAAINRAVWPCSQRAWAGWAHRISRPRLCASRPAALTRQSCWDQLDAGSGVALEALEAALTRTVVHACRLTRATLCYETSHGFTDLASSHERSASAQRGHATQQRCALRQCSLAVWVAGDGPIPLHADSDAGHTVAAPRLPPSRPAIRQRVERVLGPCADLTLVDANGHHAKSTQALVDQLPVHDVASLVPSPHADLRPLPAAAYPPWGPGPLATRPVSRCQRPIGGVERTVVRCRSAKRRRGQLRGLHQHVPTRVPALTPWQQSLATPHSGPRTPASARQPGAALLTGQAIPQV